MSSSRRSNHFRTYRSETKRTSPARRFLFNEENEVKKRDVSKTAANKRPSEERVVEKKPLGIKKENTSPASSGIGSSISNEKAICNDIRNISWSDMLEDDDESKFWSLIMERTESANLSLLNGDEKTLSTVIEEATLTETTINSDCKENLIKIEQGDLLDKVNIEKACKSESDILRPSKSSNLNKNDDNDEKFARPSEPLSSPISKLSLKRKRSEYETDDSVLKRRQKQIDYGKNTLGYQTYVSSIPKFKRSEKDMQTPNKYRKYSRRSWDQQIKIWRRFLHRFDSDASSDVMDIDISDMLDISSITSSSVLSSPLRPKSTGSQLSDIDNLDEFPPLSSSPASISNLNVKHFKAD